MYFIGILILYIPKIYHADFTCWWNIICSTILCQCKHILLFSNLRNTNSFYYIVLRFLQYVIQLPIYTILGPFNTTIGNLSHKYSTGITPSNATFGIWGKVIVLFYFLFAMLVNQSAAHPISSLFYAVKVTYVLCEHNGQV